MSKTLLKIIFSFALLCFCGKMVEKHLLENSFQKECMADTKGEKEKDDDKVDDLINSVSSITEDHLLIRDLTAYQANASLKQGFLLMPYLPPKL